MLRLVTISALVLFLFGDCHKEKNEMKVSYKIREISTNTPAYNITYTSDKSGTNANVTSSLDEWNSSTLVLTRGEFISLTLDCTAPNYDFSIDILVDDGIWKEAVLQSPNSTITISGRIGN
jgi:hypothetical protein